MRVHLCGSMSVYDVSSLTFTVGTASMLNFRHKIKVFLELQSTAASFITGHQSVRERSKS